MKREKEREREWGGGELFLNLGPKFCTHLCFLGSGSSLYDGYYERNNVF